MINISHLKSTDNDWQIQTNSDHCNGVAQIAKEFASEFGFAEWGYAMGTLHDKGKERTGFQNYIKKVSGYDINAPYNGEDKSHAYVGALLARTAYGPLAELMINQIAGHHTGLYDSDDLVNNIMEREIPDEIDKDVKKENLPTDILRTYNKPEELNHLYRILYSCLVDADYLDTEKFMTPDSFNMRGSRTSMGELLPMLQYKLNEFSHAPETPVNKIRKQVQDESLKASSMPSGFFSLTVPTGGGKTISSIVWAVNHALHNKKKRIIIAIPYTSIIVQTAAVLKSIFGEENVLEHHSNTDFEQIRDTKLRHQIKLATENWDYPIVVTTNVQLFESMFSNKPSICRKLHNLCNSVLILDEVQTLPTDFLQPIVDALKCYQKHFGMSVLFTTASQPILSGVTRGCNPNVTLKGIESIHEIIPSEMHLHNSLRRVRLEIKDEGNTYDDISHNLSLYDKVLCIVNTRRDAKEIFCRLPEENALHLSRMMCPAHIRKTINNIKTNLQNGKSTIRVVATQLIEAGVDIDFPVVFRQEAGLDSVLQAAGRCNREGKRDVCTTHVFSLSRERPLPSGFIQDGNNARKSLKSDSDWFAPETMTSYFEQLYCRQDTFDKKSIGKLLYKPKEIYFETAAKEFRLIDDTSVSVIVNWENSLDVVAKIKQEGPSYQLMKALGQYAVNIRQKDLVEILKSNIATEFLEGMYVVEAKEQYDNKIGLLMTDKRLEDTLII